MLLFVLLAANAANAGDVVCFAASVLSWCLMFWGVFQEAGYVKTLCLLTLR